jgi:AraC-like DNA-binding protein
MDFKVEDREAKSQEIDVYYSESSNFLMLEDHYHYSHELIFVTEGCSDFVISGKKYIVSKNSLVIISNLERHENIVQSNSPYKRYVLLLPHPFCMMMIREPLLLSIFIHRPKNFSHVISLDSESAEKITVFFELILKEFNERMAFWNVRCAILVVDMLLGIYRKKRNVFPNYRNSDSIGDAIKIQEYIAQNIESKITLDKLAKHFYISKFHLSRMFKTITGFTFKDYLILYRLNEAKNLLLSTDFSVTVISQMAGYRDVNHFIRIFFQREGVTPLKYRKKMAHEK